MKKINMARLFEKILPGRVEIFSKTEGLVLTFYFRNLPLCTKVLKHNKQSIFNINNLE